MSAITEHLTASALAIAALDAGAIERAADVLRQARARGALVLVCGNGGSMATAQHFACDLQSVGVRAVALDSQATLTARGNDNGYADTFAAQLRVLQEPGAVLVALSCSGISPNVREALRFFDGENAAIALFGGSDAAQFMAHNFRALLVDVASLDYEVIEDAHLAACHAIKKALAD